ncbi:MAG: zf-HC2 domain-containing protein [Planctomycetota bacterium]
MDCKKIKEKLVLKIYNELHETDSNLLEAHLSGCKACREELLMLKQTVELSSKIAMPQPCSECEEKILTTAQSVLKNRRIKTERRKTIHKILSDFTIPVTVAACAVIFFFAILHTSNQPKDTHVVTNNNDYQIQLYWYLKEKIDSINLTTENIFDNDSQIEFSEKATNLQNNIQTAQLDFTGNHISIVDIEIENISESIKKLGEDMEINILADSRNFSDN